MTKSFLTPQTDSIKINFSTLILRLGFGLMMITHGYQKLQNFEKFAPNFLDFLGLGGPVSLGLTIFAEFLCAIFITLGLVTRFAVIPLIITMLVAAFYVHGGDPFAKKELALAFTTGYLALLFLGSGRFSLDALIFKSRSNSLYN